MLAFREWNLQNKLLAMLVCLLLLSLTSLFLLHLYNERRLLNQVLDYTTELSAAIEAAQAQPLMEQDPRAALEAYAERLRELGVADVSIADAADEVQASTNPRHVGKRLSREKRAEYVVRGVIGEDDEGSGRISTFTIPLVVGDRRVGYLVLTRILDDFSALSREALVSRLVALASVFGVGIVLSLYLSWSFSRPTETLAHAVRRVAAGDLEVTLPTHPGAEWRALGESFNEMVHRLRERRELEERLYFAERTAALGRLSTAIAHEIRNPLNMMNLAIDHLRVTLAPSDADERRQTDELLAAIKAEIVRLNRLVVEFLSFGKPLATRRQACSIDEIIAQVAALVEHKARDQAVRLRLDLGTGSALLSGDAELLKTCLLNLMLNGLEAMPDGGVLDVATSGPGRERSIELVVRDTGRGMTPLERSRAFEPYFSTKSAGVGLGLSLTRQVVEEHGGSIELESAVGSGTEICIRFQVEASTL